MTCDNNEKNVIGTRSKSNEAKLAERQIDHNNRELLQEPQSDPNNRQLLQEPQSDRNKHKSRKPRRDVTCDNEKNAIGTRSKSNEAKLAERQLRPKKTNKKNEHGNGKKKDTRK